MTISAVEETMPTAAGLARPPTRKAPQNQRTVAIISGHQVVLRGLTDTIAGQADLAVCAEIQDDRGALYAISAQRPDFVLLETCDRPVTRVGLMGPQSTWSRDDRGRPRPAPESIAGKESTSGLEKQQAAVQ